MSHEPDPRLCDRCGEEIDEDDAFCPACGAVAGDGPVCAVHDEREAIGACVVCGLVLCEECVDDVGGCFLCAAHAEYDVVDGSVRVFSGADPTAADDVSDCLGQAGLHPAVSARRASPLSLLTADRLPPELEEEPELEIEVRVPCAEVGEAERLLRDFGFLS